MIHFLCSCSYLFTFLLSSQFMLTYLLKINSLLSWPTLYILAPPGCLHPLCTRYTSRFCPENNVVIRNIPLPYSGILAWRIWFWLGNQPFPLQVSADEWRGRPRDGVSCSSQARRWMPIEFPLRIAVWLLRLSRSRLESLIVNTASYSSKASAFGPNFRLSDRTAHI